jgi:hypothetical protein
VCSHTGFGFQNSPSKLFSAMVPSSGEDAMLRPKPYTWDKAPPPGEDVPVGCLAGDSGFGSLVVEREALALEKKDLDDFVFGEGGRGMAAIGDCGGWGSYPSAKLWLNGECGPGV